MSQKKKKKATIPPVRVGWIGATHGHAMQPYDPEYLRTTTLTLLNLRKTFDADFADLAAAIDRLGSCDEAYALVQNQGHSASALLIQIASDDSLLLDCQFPAKGSEHFHSFHSALQNLLISYSVGTEDAAISNTIQRIVEILDEESSAQEKVIADACAIWEKDKAKEAAEQKPRRCWVLRVLFGE